MGIIPPHLRQTPLPAPKDCKKCGNKRKRHPDGNTFCPYCRAQYIKQYQENNRDRLSNYYKERYDDNKEVILAKQKVYNDKNRKIINKRSKDRYDNLPPEYHTWTGMNSRCFIPSNDSYESYKELQVEIYPAWQSPGGFPAFQEYLLKTIGPKPGPGYSLDRIDNNKGYVPGNLKWSTPKEQANNRRNSKQYLEAVSDDDLLDYLGK